MWSQKSRDHMYTFVDQHLITRIQVMMSVIQVVLLVATLPREMVEETRDSKVAPHEQQVGFWPRF